MKERAIRVTKISILFLIAGLLYALFCTTFGFGIPCAFYEVTGYKCAGCGVTHMCLSLLKLDFKAAYDSNQMVFVLLPFVIAVVLFHTLQYIKSGSIRTLKYENMALYVCVGILVAWGVVRNII